MLHICLSVHDPVRALEVNEKRFIRMVRLAQRIGLPPEQQDDDQQPEERIENAVQQEDQVAVAEYLEEQVEGVGSGAVQRVPEPPVIRSANRVANIVLTQAQKRVQEQTTVLKENQQKAKKFKVGHK